MCLVLSIKLPEWRLQLVFEMRSLRIFENDVVIKAERLVLTNNGHL